MRCVMSIRWLGKVLAAGVVLACVLVSTGLCSDWARFRGPGGSGFGTDERPVPTEWTDTKNVKWAVDLPGPGSSSPIVVGDRVFVTCWTGYGLDQRNPGDQANLKRNLVCIDRATGKTVWSREVDAVLPEDPYRGMFAQHGYASHTPVSDGERVFVFFGKTGVLAFDLDGNRLWQTSVGTGSGAQNWGTASSPIVYKNLVIVPAFAESLSLVALDKETGAKVWEMSDDYLDSTWSTPILVEAKNGRTDIVLAIPNEVWGVDPETGKVRWYCESYESESTCESPIAHDGIVYVVGGRNGGAIAVRAGGEGNVTKTHVLWTAEKRARINTPLYHDGYLYWVYQGTAHCADAATGETVYETRLTRAATPARRESRAEGPGGEASGPRAGGRSPGGQRAGGGRGGQDYSSPVAAGGKLYFVTRAGETIVLALGPEFKELARNRFGSDTGDFSATPAISNGELFIRSSERLYCVGSPEGGQ